jgi:hypothetical protein
VKSFHLLKDHTYRQEIRDFSSITLLKFLLNFYALFFYHFICLELFSPHLRAEIHEEGAEDQDEHSQLP